MKHFAVTQGSPEWHALRLGIPTASEFKRIITPKKHELAAGRTQYALELVTERILGMPLDNVTTEAMQIGSDWEIKAVAQYELEHDCDTEVAGFCLTDDGLVGASPDRFVGDRSLLEIKTHPGNPALHVAHMLNGGTLVADHFIQVQGQIHVTERDWCDLVSYFPGLPMVCIRVSRDEEFQAKLKAALKQFCAELSDMIQIANERGWMPKEKAAPDYSADWITEDDLEDILARRKA